MTLFKGTIIGENVHSILSAATVLVDECHVFLEDNKVRIRGTDPGGVAIVIIEISEEAFNDAEIGNGNVCWDFSEMSDMIKMADASTDIELQIENHDLILDFIDLHFTLKLINTDTLKKDTEKPEMDLDAEIVLDSSAFKRGIQAADLVADHIEFGIDDNESAFYMEAKGDVNEVILKRKKQDLVTLTTEAVSSTFSVDYLKDICGAIPNDVEVAITLGEDYPAEISYSIIDGNSNVTYFIAPRIQPDP